MVTVIVLILWVLIITLNPINVMQTLEVAVVKNRSISLLFIFAFTYCIGWGPLRLLYPLEWLRHETRAKGIAMYLVRLSHWKVSPS